MATIVAMVRFLNAVQARTGETRIAKAGLLPVGPWRRSLTVKRNNAGTFLVVGWLGLLMGGWDGPSLLVHETGSSVSYMVGTLGKHLNNKIEMLCDLSQLLSTSQPITKWKSRKFRRAWILDIAVFKSRSDLPFERLWLEETGMFTSIFGHVVREMTDLFYLFHALFRWYIEDGKPYIETLKNA